MVYATNNEIGFDYLRDNLKSDYKSLFFKKNSFAIVDEVDSILIDEARTPLVISAEATSSIDLFPKINKIITLFKKSDYELNEESKNILLTNDGMEFAEKLLLDNNLIKGGTLQDLDNMSLNHNIIQALRAHKLFIKDKDYIIKDKQIVIIDELSGRPMEGRRYGDGLHQAIEAKENLMIQKENQTIASVTYQNFFRSYIIVVRDSTTLAVGDAAGSRPRVYSSSATTSGWDAYDISPIPINILDSPNTTSQVTYKIQYKDYQGTSNSGSAIAYINRCHNDRDSGIYDPRTVSVLTVQEIAG